MPASVAEALFANSLYEGHILGVARKLISGRKCVISLIAVPTALVREGMVVLCCVVCGAACLGCVCV